MGARDVSETGLCWLTYSEQMILRRILKAMTESQDQNLELIRDNQALRAEIEALQRMRHAEQENRK